MQLPIEKKRSPFRLDGSALKLIAVFSMLIDHSAVALIETGVLHSLDETVLFSLLNTEFGRRWYTIDLVFRMIGRIAFPLFCFLLTEGFLHTHDRKKYGAGLLLFALLSEVPFDLLVTGRLYDPGYQNVYWTLAAGLAVLWGMDRTQGSLSLQLLILALGAGAAELLRTDYGGIGVLLIALFYLLRKKPFWQTLCCGALTAWESWSVLGTAALSLIPIRLYSGKRGKLRLKYFFYWFYPIHILLLVGLRFLLFRV